MKQLHFLFLYALGTTKMSSLPSSVWVTCFITMQKALDFPQTQPLCRFWQSKPSCLNLKVSFASGFVDNSILIRIFYIIFNIMVHWEINGGVTSLVAKNTVKPFANCSPFPPPFKHPGASPCAPYPHPCCGITYPSLKNCHLSNGNCFVGLTTFQNFS